MVAEEGPVDPRIIEDVQRALRLRARHEARVKASQSNPTSKDSQLRSDMPSYSTHSSPVRASVQIPPPIVPSENLSNDSEIDFSPSIGTIPLHPVPSSSNGGATLDWTGLTSEDEKTEKRWILPIHKRRHKEKYPPLSTRTIVEKQDTLYAGMILFSCTTESPSC